MSNGKGMGNQKRLTPKQLKFALLIVSKGDRMTGAECAIEAGYSEKAANQTASNLQSLKMFPLVVEEIDRLRKEILTGSIDQLSKAEVEEKLKEIEKQFSINAEDYQVLENKVIDDSKKVG